MPRCHIRCNIITDPEKGGVKKLRPVDIRPYLPGTFHVPVKEIYEILGMSHHTLAPLRRNLGLSRWPFADICKGDFSMDGVPQSWDDVENQRLSLMKDADERIVKILEVMGERALKHKRRMDEKLNEKLSKRKRPASCHPRATTTTGPPPPSPDENANYYGYTRGHDEEASPPQESPITDDNNNEVDGETLFSGDGYDWDGLSDLLLRHLDAPEGTLFLSPEEIFQ